MVVVWWLRDAVAARLELIVDPSLCDVPELDFNAARLDRSVALNTQDYLRLAAPRIARIAVADIG